MKSSEVRSINEFNDRFRFKRFQYAQRSGGDEKGGASSYISGFLFYSAIIAMVLVAFIYSQRSSTGNNLFGYSYYNILTTSMQSEIPQGSFVLVKSVPGSTLKVDDTITYFENESKVVTHKIIEILPDFEDSGQYGYRTKGVDNRAPDNYVTFEGNVIGKVVWDVPYLGFALELIAKNIVAVVIIFGIIFAIAMFLKVAVTPDEDDEFIPDVV